MNKKYEMILDTEGQRGGSLFSNRIYFLNEQFGDELIKRGRAVPYKSKKMVIIHTTDGKQRIITWGEYLKRGREYAKEI